MNLGTPIAKGNTANIYLYENKIIKVFKDYFPDTESTYEANKQRYAHSRGLPVPKIFDVTRIDGRQAIIMEFVKGRTMGEILTENIDLAEYYMNISIDKQQKIHEIRTDALEPMSAKLTRQIKSAHLLDKGQKYALLQKLNAMTYEKKLCHGDFHLFNLMLSDDQRVTIIDWVDASAGDIRADVYRTYLLYSRLSRELAEMYLRLYCQKSGLSRDEVFQWAPIIAGARLSENVSSENTERLMRIIEHDCPLE
ncbi:MAG TPA: aminoglycoside phosphotransferase family protein [Virgibacillus sp.]|nr:aminoglycoside phosphotransferase family protein [Virgibacillus sp.]HLR68973.1 aminoglycoside phosphotransferase family protein [Virgibacillus sp.]